MSSRRDSLVAFRIDTLMSQVPRILILEDDNDLRDMLEEVLRDEGYQVIAVSNGADAVAQAGSQNFDLIIADIRMKGMDGLEAVEQTQKINPNIGSLIVSGYATEEDISRARRLEIGGYIKKPFKMQELLDYVRRQLSYLEAFSKDLEDEHLYMKSFEWAMEAAAKALDETKTIEGSLMNAALLTEKLCRLLECSPAACEVVKFAAIAHGLDLVSSVTVPCFMLPPNNVFPTLATILQQLQHREDDEAIEIQAIRHAIRCEFLRKPKEGQLDARLEEILKKNTGDARPRKAGPTGHLRTGLVSLARTLEDMGDLANAETAYQNLCSSSAGPRERTEGFLGLARVSSLSDHNEQARKFALTTLKEAKNQGPLALSSVGLEAALLLDSLRAPEAEKALHLVQDSVKKLDLETEASLLALALDPYKSGKSASDADFEELVSPQASQAIDKHRRWLMAHLFSRAAEEQVLDSKLLSRVVTNFPKEFRQHFIAERASSKLSVARVLENARFLPEYISKLLCQDSDAAIREIGLKLKIKVEDSDFAPLLRVYSFGAFEMSGKDGPLSDSEWRTRKVKYLLALLASDWGRSVPEEYLLETFWPKDVTRTKRNLYWATTVLRNILKSMLPSFEDPLIRDSVGLKLHSDLHRWHDLNEFEQALQRAQELERSGARDTKAIRRNRRLAARLYRGSYLEGCFFEFAAQLRTKTEEMAADNFIKSAQLALATDDFSEALEHIRLGLELAPYRQDAHSLKLRIHISLGQSAEAINQYEKARAFLAQEYELEPSTELIELYHRARLGFGAS